MGKKFVFLLLLFIFSSLASFVFAQIVLPNPLGVNNFPDLITNIATSISGLVAGLAVLMFIIAGIVFIMSAGNPGKIEQAKKIAIYTAIGSGIVLAGSGLVALIMAIIGA